MSGVVAWRVANHPDGPFALRKTKPIGWAYTVPLVLQSDLAAAIAWAEAAEAKVADAEPRLAKVARGDAARINALQRYLWFVEPDYANDGWRVGKASKDGRPNHYGNSLRSAIDAAIAAQQAEGES